MKGSIVQEIAVSFISPDRNETMAEQHWLFSYGTLQQLQVQLDTFGRPLTGQTDVLVGYQLAQVQITDPAVLASSGQEFHPILRYSGQPSDQVQGTVFALSSAEIEAADRYEVADYRRVATTLLSGLSAWVYVAAKDSWL
jgi:gamma-glutamylcyclotransferase (GGCT)/AIG2-like uncharacterized protein YtfP